MLLDLVNRIRSERKVLDIQVWVLSRSSRGRPESISQGRPLNVRLRRPLDVISGRPQDVRLGRPRDGQIGSLGDVLGTNIYRLGWLQISGFPKILTSFPKEWNTKLQLPTKICSRIMSLLKNGYCFYTYQIFFSCKNSKNKNTRLKMTYRRVNHLTSLPRRWLWIDLIQTCLKCRYFTCFFLWKKELEKCKTNVSFFNLFNSKIAFFANFQGHHYT